MIKKIDNLGRVVVPKGFRMMLGLKPGDPLDVDIDSGRLIIAPHRDGCTFCGSEQVASTLFGKNICASCIEELKLNGDGA